MYNTTTHSYTMEDAGGSYNWIVEALDVTEYQTMTDEEIGKWVDTLIETAKEVEIANLSDVVDDEELTFPRFGYTTAQVFENAEDYAAFKRDEIESDLNAERDILIQFIKGWIAKGENTPE